MERAMASSPPRRLLRLLLCALGAAGGFVVLGLAFGALSASAADTGRSTPPSSAMQADAGSTGGTAAGSGLLGSVGSLLTAVTTPVSSTVDAVTSTLSSVVAPGVPTAPPPATTTPVSAPPVSVPPVSGPAAATPDAGTPATTPGPVTQTVTSVTGVVDQLIGAVPVVGPGVSSGLGQLSGITAPVTGVVDGVLGDADVLVEGILGPPDPSGAGAAPPESGTAPTGGGPPAPIATGTEYGIQPSDAVAARHPSSPAGTAVRESRPAPSTQPSRLATIGDGASSHPATRHVYPPPNGPDNGPQSSGAGSGNGSGNGSPGGSAGAATQETAVIGAPLGRLTERPLDDRLPLIPTFETDSAPD
jgi:hypothetical protein